MPQLTLIKIDAFSSAGSMYSNASATTCAASGGHGQERQVSGFSATFSTAGGCATSGAHGEWLGNRAAMSTASVLASENGASACSYLPACGKPDKCANAGGKGVMSSIGSVIIGCVSKCNDLLNSPLVSSVGQIFNKFGLCGQLCHLVPDLGGYAVSKAVAGFGEALGGTGSPDYHFEHEWVRGESSSTRT
ncbi:hypothetical protein [Paraburkholderia aromaticivorans]|uniref:hypothetical protein n=1 Tax=Paraburkholderia aromaticivorans TaxID=2026199 RepID=UPI0014561D64|nr:hypothetical protein [Paraburkholderia aromaticivorans]